MATYMTPEYLAGFFDGEGTVGFFRNGRNRGDTGSYRYRARVSVCQTSLPVLEAIRKKYGGRLVTRKMDQHYPNAKELHRVQWTNKKEINKVLADILPFLIVKAEEAYIMKLYSEGEITASQGRYITKGDANPNPRHAWTSGARRE